MAGFRLRDGEVVHVQRWVRIGDVRGNLMLTDRRIAYVPDGAGAGLALLSPLAWLLFRLRRPAAPVQQIARADVASVELIDSERFVVRGEDGEIYAGVELDVFTVDAVAWQERIEAWRRGDTPEPLPKPS